MSDLKIIKVESRADLRRFIKFPYKLYRQDLNWVPHLLLERYRMFDNEKNPFFAHSEVAFFLAKRGKKVEGRIAAIINHNHNLYHDDRVGFFGFFETVEDEKVGMKLLSAAEEFLKENGMEVMRGPVNPSTLNEIGMLYEGYNEPAVLLMSYNPVYYNRFMTRYGMIEAKDIWAYRLDAEKLIIPEKIKRVSEITRRKENITLRKINLSSIKEEIAVIREIYNDGWKDNWGFFPLTAEELEHVAGDLVQIVEPELLLVAEVNGEPAGFVISVPNMNEILIKIRSGKLFPWGFLKLLVYKNSVKGLKVFTLGIKKKFENLGLSGLLYLETVERGIKLGYHWAEVAVYPEQNKTIIRTLEQMGAVLYKKYRVCEKKIS